MFVPVGLFTVVIMCHYDPDVMARLIENAQDRGMLEGDYAWFILSDFPTQALLKPWTATAVFNTSAFQYRLKGLYAVNLVSTCTSDSAS